jgi:hypothetical protein
VSEINAPASLSTPGGTISFNATGSATYYFFTALSGLDQAPLRVTIDPKPQAAGAILHPFLRDARHATFEGLVVADSTSTRNTMCDALVAALESIEQADGTYSWTPTGQSTKTLTVRCDIPVSFPESRGPAVKTFMFGLVAANPVIA